MTEGLGLPGITNGAVLRAIIESSDDAIFAKRLDGTIVSWNKGAQKMYGYTPEEILGQNVAVLSPQGDNEIGPIMDKIRQGIPIEHYITQRLTKDGRIIHIRLSISPIRNPDHEVIGASVIAHELTDDERRLNSIEGLSQYISQQNAQLENLNKTVGSFATSTDVETRVVNLEHRIKTRSIWESVVVLVVASIFALILHNSAINSAQRNLDNIRVAGCKQSVEQTMRERGAFYANTRTLIDAATKNNPSAASDPRTQAYIDSQDKATRQALPLRDCSKAGIDRWVKSAPKAVVVCTDDGKGYCLDGQ